MCDLFLLNFASLSYSSTKRENKKGLQFVPSEHIIIFKCVARIYKEANAIHGITRVVLVSFVKDETKVKDNISLDSESDILVGFCDPK